MQIKYVGVTGEDVVVRDLFAIHVPFGWGYAVNAEATGTSAIMSLVRPLAKPEESQDGYTVDIQESKDADVVFAFYDYGNTKSDGSIVKNAAFAEGMEAVMSKAYDSVKMFAMFDDPTGSKGGYWVIRDDDKLKVGLYTHSMLGRALYNISVISETFYYAVTPASFKTGEFENNRPEVEAILKTISPVLAAEEPEEAEVEDTAEEAVAEETEAAVVAAEVPVAEENVTEEPVAEAEPEETVTASAEPAVEAVETETAEGGAERPETETIEETESAEETEMVEEAEPETVEPEAELSAESTENVQAEEAETVEEASDAAIIAAAKKLLDPAAREEACLNEIEACKGRIAELETRLADTKRKTEDRSVAWVRELGDKIRTAESEKDSAFANINYMQNQIDKTTVFKVSQKNDLTAKVELARAEIPRMIANVRRLEQERIDTIRRAKTSVTDISDRLDYENWLLMFKQEELEMLRKG